jgi:hypothetical protein
MSMGSPLLRRSLSIVLDGADEDSVCSAANVSQHQRRHASSATIACSMEVDVWYIGMGYDICATAKTPL